MGRKLPGCFWSPDLWMGVTMATFQESGKVRVEIEELTRWRISGPTAGRQLLIAVMGMPSTPTALDALRRLTVRIRSGSDTQWGANAPAHTLYGRGPASQAPASRAARDASAATRAPTPAKYWLSWSALNASWSGGGAHLEPLAEKSAPYCFSRLQKRLASLHSHSVRWDLCAHDNISLAWLRSRLYSRLSATRYTTLYVYLDDTFATLLYSLCPHLNACSFLRKCNQSSVSVLEGFWNGKGAFEEFEQTKERALPDFCKFDLSGKGQLFKST